MNIGSKYLNETINCFQNDTEEISFIVKNEQLFIKNYVQDDSGKTDLIFWCFGENCLKMTIYFLSFVKKGSEAKSVNTQVNFDCDDFNTYEIEKETDITFCLKEFKVCLQFGIYFDINLDIFFQKKGRLVTILN